jgi:protein CpxP
MKKNVMFLVLMMMSTIIFAQRHQGDPKGSGRSEQLKKELSLSDDQVSKVKSIRMKYAERNAAIRKDTSLTQGMARKQMKNLMAAQETELKGVLTADQWTKYTAMKARRGEERKKHQRGKTEKG